MKNYNLITADDDPTIRKLFELKSSQYGYRPVTVENGVEVLELIHDDVDAIVLDLDMPGMDGLECLKELSKLKNNIPVIMLSGTDEAETAMKAAKLGAREYLSKPFDFDELFDTIGTIRQQENQKKEEAQEEQTSPTHKARPFEMVTYSSSTNELKKKAKIVAQLDSTVLLTGESGTGKGVLAKYIHSQSSRSEKPFVTISCPALPRELLESELFGHEKGAFTGAIKKHIGKIESAQGGTIFLDEIGDMPIDLQPKLLNVLQDQQFTRVGGDHAIKSDVRIIAATNIDFEEKIANHEFREDLYYRLSVIPLRQPALRERPEEVLVFAEHFLSKICENRQIPKIQISPEAQDLLKNYSWPGNVRQLENIIERASAFCEEQTIRPQDLPERMTKSSTTQKTITQLAGRTLTEIETEAIRQTLLMHDGNKAQTARSLGITEKSVYNKIKRLNLS